MLTERQTHFSTPTCTINSDKLRTQLVTEIVVWSYQWGVCTYRCTARVDVVIQNTNNNIHLQTGAESVLSNDDHFAVWPSDWQTIVEEPTSRNPSLHLYSALPLEVVSLHSTLPSLIWGGGPQLMPESKTGKLHGLLASPLPPPQKKKNTML